MYNLDKSENWRNWEEWEKTKRSYYGSNTVLQIYGGCIDFNPDKQTDLVGGERLSYDEYLDLQMITCENKEKVRWKFAQCYYNIPAEFKGQIERITKKSVCFKRIYVSGMYSDGTFFDGKENHVWIDKKGLEQYSVGDCLEFFAEPYRYIKTSNGKQIDFGLRYLSNIKQINNYKLPSDDELLIQSIDDIVCDTCILNEQCTGTCIRNKKEIKDLREDMIKFAKHDDLG